jgi:hypothetical protein
VIDGKEYVYEKPKMNLNFLAQMKAQENYIKIFKYIETEFSCSGIC